MDNVQKHNTCINVPSSQTFRSYYTSAVLISFYTENCILHGVFVLNPSMKYLHGAEYFLRGQQFGIIEFLHLIYRIVF
jgi:hypothetical protein